MNRKLFLFGLLLILIFSVSDGVQENYRKLNKKYFSVLLVKRDNLTVSEDTVNIKVDDNLKVYEENDDSHFDLRSNLESSNYQNEVTIAESSDVIVVNDWNELQYYCSLTDKEYTLKLKENTNFFPDPNNPNNQIKIYNDVKLLEVKVRILVITLMMLENIMIRIVDILNIFQFL